MNFVAIIGVVVEKEITKNNNWIVSVKVEKNSLEENIDNWYDIIKCEMNEQEFMKEIKQLKSGDIIGIKGRIKLEDNQQNIISERVQIF